jgi:hypothetical protein
MTDPVFDDADDELAFELASRLAAGEPTLFSGSPARELASLDASLAPAEWALFEPEALVHAYTLRLHAGAHVAVCDLGAPFSVAEKDLRLDAASAVDALVRCAKRAGFRYVALVVRDPADAAAAVAAAAASGAHLLVFPAGRPEADLAAAGWVRPFAWFENEGPGMHISGSSNLPSDVSVCVATCSNLDAFLGDSAGSALAWPDETLAARDVAALSCHLIDMHHS